MAEIVGGIFGGGSKGKSSSKSNSSNPDTVAPKNPQEMAERVARLQRVLSNG